MAKALKAIFTLHRASTIYRHLGDKSVPVLDPLFQDLYQGIILLGSYHALHASPLSAQGRLRPPGHGEKTTMELLADRARPHVTLLLLSDSEFLNPVLSKSKVLSNLLADVAEARKAKTVYVDLRLPGSPFDELQLARYPTNDFASGVYSKLPVTKLFDAVLLLYSPVLS